MNSEIRYHGVIAEVKEEWDEIKRKATWNVIIPHLAVQTSFKRWWIRRSQQLTRLRRHYSQENYKNPPFVNQSSVSISLTICLNSQRYEIKIILCVWHKGHHQSRNIYFPVMILNWWKRCRLVFWNSEDVSSLLSCLRSWESWTRWFHVFW